MKNINTEHIDDDFLKHLVGLTKDEVPSGDFTSRVMAGIPKTSIAVESVQKSLMKPWQWVLLLAAFTGIVFFIYSINFSSLFTFMATDTPDGKIDYITMLSSIMQLFSQAFSAFKLTNISLMIGISITALYFGDRFLKSRAQEANQNFA